MVHHRPAGGHEHEEEGAEQLGAQATPLLGRVVEVADHEEQPLLRRRQQWRGVRVPRGLGVVEVVTGGGQLAHRRIALDATNAPGRRR